MTELRPRLSDRPIPEATTGPITEEHVPVVLWVHAGTATVRTPGATHHLSADEAIWIPPGVAHRTRADEGSIVFPIFPRAPELRGALAEVRLLTIPPGWADWLISQFDFNRFHHRAPPSGTVALLDLVLEGVPGPGATAAAGPPLPMPRSPEGWAVAQALLRSPGSARPTQELAAREHISVRTLQRQFLNETGIALSEWRTRARVTVAADHLAEGRTVGWAGRAVGYETPAGFTRAFRRHFGVAPGTYARDVGTAADPSDVGGPLGTDAGEAAVDRRRREPPPVPRRRLWNLVHDCHVLWWAQCGEVRIRVGSHQHVLQRGEAIWLPAGSAASVELAAGSTLLPLGQRYGALPLTAATLPRFAFPAEAEPFLLHTVLAEYTLFQPTTEQPSLVDELFPEPTASASASGEHDPDAALTGAVAAIALALRRNPADARSLADWAARLRLPVPQLSREFSTQAGASFPAWRAQLRMTLAREMLRFGDPPREVSGALGYATPAVFGKVFTTAHGLSPRRYQQRVSDALAIA